MKKLRHVAVGLALVFTGTAFAQAPYPSKPVRIIVGFAPGGGIDVMARFFAPRLSEAMGQQFIVDNRPGASGNIGGDLVAKAAPDGYTLLMASITHAINATMFSKLPFDPVRDFAPVSTVALNADVIAVHPSLPVKSLAELVAMAKARPGQLSYASAGAGTLMHVGMELFLSMAGIKMLHVPYNGAGPSTLAVLGGQVPVLSTSLVAALPHAKAGKLRMLAVTSGQRTPLAPEYPTVTEAAGLPGYEAIVWIGMLAPANTPPAIINRLNSEIAKMLQTTEVRDQLGKLSNDPYPLSPAAFAELIKSDIVKWGKIVRDSGAKAD